MPSFIDFNPTIDIPFVFDVGMGMRTRMGRASWSPYGLRYYLHLRETDNTTILYLPIIGSPMARVIEKIEWWRGRTVITFIRPFGYDIGQSVQLTVRGCAPDVLNGRRVMLVESERVVGFQLTDDPGPVTALGSISHDINISEGYIDDAVLLFREAAEQFEAYP